MPLCAGRSGLARELRDEVVRLRELTRRENSIIAGSMHLQDQVKALRAQLAEARAELEENVGVMQVLWRRAAERDLP